MRCPAPSRPPLPAQLLALALAVLCGACSAFGHRAEVPDEQARDLLTRAVGLAASGELDRLCELSSAEASTCAESLAATREAAPETGPVILCSVAAPSTGPLRGGRVLVVEGEDARGEPYLTEFVVYDDGRTGVGVLDAVFWSGLSIRSYEEDRVTWGFDSASQTCQRGGLPSGSRSPSPPSPSTTEG